MFAAIGPAARAAGSALLVGLAVAAAVAYCNAVASAQLAAAHPTSGGTYVYGRERLGQWWGFTAGWGFVVGKTASCAAMALTVASYAVPGPAWAQRVVAVAAVVALAAVNYRGITRTVALTRILVVLVLGALAVVVAGIWVGGRAGAGGLTGWYAVGAAGPHGVLQAAGLLFFAFAGYARIATLGEEVRNPARTIPRAVPLALGLTVTIYAAVAVSALAAAGPAALSASPAPLVTAVSAAGAAGVAPVVRAGAAVAALGSLLALMAGIGRTGLAMARNRDLPAWLAAVHPRHRVPHRAEVALAALVSALAVAVDLRRAIGFSSFSVLVYDAVANLAALTQPAAQRRWPRLLNVVGALGCLALVVTLPLASIGAGLAVFAVGLAGRLIVLVQRRSEAARSG